MTISEFQRWLDQFPETTEVEVVTAFRRPVPKVVIFDPNNSDCFEYRPHLTNGPDKPFLMLGRP